MTTSSSRRRFLALAGAASGALLAACQPAGDKAPLYAPATPTLRSPDRLDGEAARTRLKDGNIRYVASNLQYPDQSAERRAQVAQSQSPFAAVICCSDSRVPPEIIFDQGLSDLFVVRVAGSVLDDPLLGSLEYGVDHLNIPLIMVLGHTRCSAVRAALEAFYLGAEVPGNFGSVVQAIEPAVEKAQAQSGDPWLNAIRANVQLVAAQLEASSPIIAKAVKAKELTVVRALYDLETGWVEILPAEKSEGK